LFIQSAGNPKKIKNKLEAIVQRGLVVILLAIVIAVGYGVVFSVVYPLVPPDGSLAALFTVLGLLTAFAIKGVAKFFSGR
jgi:hypothetical protein